MEAMRTRFKKFRKKSGFTLQELGDALEVSPTAVNAWEQGRNDIPKSIRKQLELQFHVNRTWLEQGRGSMFVADKSPQERDEDAFNRVALQLVSRIPEPTLGFLISLARSAVREYDARVASGSDAESETESADETKLPLLAPISEPTVESVKRGRGRPRKYPLE